MPPRKSNSKAVNKVAVRTSTRSRRGKGNLNDNDETGGDKAKVKPVVSKGRKRKNATAAVTPVLPTTEVKKESDSEASTSKEEVVEMKKLKFSGKVPVDELCTECFTGYHVFKDNTKTDKLYNIMLNQTNIGVNNNKYFLIQLLKNDVKAEYVTWFRWGRIGKVAGKTLQRHGGNLMQAQDAFEQKYLVKTGNYWHAPFRKVPKFYDVLEMDYGEEEEEKAKPKENIKKLSVLFSLSSGSHNINVVITANVLGLMPDHCKIAVKKPEVESKLDKRVQEVIDLIFDVKEFEACIKELEFDVKKAPLGKLTSKQIKAGYETLKEIEKCIQAGDFGKNLSDACSEFYTRIPHDFGMKVPPLIKTPEHLQQKIQLLEALNEIQIAIQMIDEDDVKTDDVNIKDLHYESLGCELEPLDTTHDDYKMVKKYISNSHGSTHSQYSLAVENVYKINKEDEEKRFKKNIGNRMLLWHGSRLPNWCGILKHGLRIAPPEAPASGYGFGKGVYFADIVSKSANYCFANRRQPSGFLLLCEVALGETNNKVTTADYTANRLPKGKHSTKALGREVPDPKGHTKMDCGTTVPLGKPITETSSDGQRHLMYNEYIVCDVAQIKARYLVKTKFNFRN